MLGLSAVLTLAFLPIDSPTDALGAWGWLCAACLGLLSAAGVLWIRDRSRPAGFKPIAPALLAGVARPRLRTGPRRPPAAAALP